MDIPPELVRYQTEDEYRRHYIREYCQKVTQTHDGIRVFFSPDRFNHAFYKTRTGIKGRKDEFARERAERIDWIKATLESSNSVFRVGWNSYKKSLDWGRRVTITYDDYLVVIDLGKPNQETLKKAQFVTAFCAGKSMEKIKKNPIWSLERYRENIILK